MQRSEIDSINGGVSAAENLGYFAYSSASKLSFKVESRRPAPLAEADG